MILKLKLNRNSDGRVQRNDAHARSWEAGERMYR